MSYRKLKGNMKESADGKTLQQEEICLTDFGSIRGRVIYRLVSRERNRELLEDVPYVECMGDLAAVFFVLLFVKGESDAVLPVRNQLMQLWDTDRDELYGLAEKNTPELLGWELVNMLDVLSDLTELRRQEDFVPEGMAFPMYVLTNRMKLYGAGCLLYPWLLEELAGRLGGGFYVLPSSVHETLLVPAKAVPRPEELAAMVREVNETQVPEEEVLSDHPYYYSAEGAKLLAAA